MDYRRNRTTRELQLRDSRDAAIAMLERGGSPGSTAKTIPDDAFALVSPLDRNRRTGAEVIGFDRRP